MNPLITVKGRSALLFTAGTIILLSLIATLDIMVFAPQRLEKARQARRALPPKLVRPSLLTDGAAQREVVTAFRLEEWLKQPEPEPETGEDLITVEDPADTYLQGYLLWQEGEEQLKKGDPSAARTAWKKAANVFSRISQQEPDFEREMVKYRRQKIDEALARLPAPAAGGGGKTQSFFNRATEGRALLAGRA